VSRPPAPTTGTALSPAPLACSSLSLFVALFVAFVACRRIRSRRIAVSPVSPSQRYGR
jgi:hypothetical protein